MEYNPIAVVWETTMACNMRCKHCGSGCGEHSPEELTTDEALKLCDDMGEMGLRIVTLSGGEPFLRKDWYILAKRMSDNKITPNMISNGWFIDDDILDKAFDSGIESIGISLDGLKETHDFMRREGSFERALNSLQLMDKRGMISSVVTTINKRNITELPELKNVLIEKGVKRWQLQIGLPMGNFSNCRDMVVDPTQVDDIIDFAYESMLEDKIGIYLADCVGYYNMKGIKVTEKYSNVGEHSALWRGCFAGKYVFGIRSNGDVIGCTSIRDDSLIEGNVRKRSIKEIWTDPERFAWNRKMTKDNLTGFCGKCVYGSHCLGGCTNTKLTIAGTLYETTHCSYHNAIERAASGSRLVNDHDKLVSIGRRLMEKGEPQVAEIYYSKALEIKPESLEILASLGYIHFMLENYSQSLQFNKKVLTLAPYDAYAYKGQGNCLAKMGLVDEAVNSLKKAIELSKGSLVDAYHDLAVVLRESNRKKEALEALSAGMAKSVEFCKTSQAFYNMLLSEI